LVHLGIKLVMPEKVGNKRIEATHRSLEHIILILLILHHSNRTIPHKIMNINLLVFLFEH